MDWIYAIGFFSFWILLQRVILPRLGISTCCACAVDTRRKKPGLDGKIAADEVAETTDIAGRQ